MNKKIFIGAFMAILFLAAATLVVAAVQPFSVSAAPAAQSNGVGQDARGRRYCDRGFVCTGLGSRLVDDARDVNGVG